MNIYKNRPLLFQGLLFAELIFWYFSRVAWDNTNHLQKEPDSEMLPFSWNILLREKERKKNDTHYQIIGVDAALYGREIFMVPTKAA